MIDILVAGSRTGEKIKTIIGKVNDNIRLSPEEGLELYQNCDLGMLAVLAGIVKKRISGDNIFFNRNFHIEPTNKCIYNCRFCSYHKPAGDPDSWDYSIEQMMEMVKKFDNKPVTEVHIVGGVHPTHDLHYYGNLIAQIKKHRPGLHIKAFSAIELDFMIRKSGYSYEEGLKKLKEYGLDSIPVEEPRYLMRRSEEKSVAKKVHQSFGLKYMKLPTKPGFHQMQQSFTAIKRHINIVLTILKD